MESSEAFWNISPVGRGYFTMLTRKNFTPSWNTQRERRITHLPSTSSSDGLENDYGYSDGVKFFGKYLWEYLTRLASFRRVQHSWKNDINGRMLTSNFNGVVSNGPSPSLSPVPFSHFRFVTMKHRCRPWGPSFTGIAS